MSDDAPEFQPHIEVGSICSEYEGWAMEASARLITRKDPVAFFFLFPKEHLPNHQTSDLRA